MHLFRIPSLSYISFHLHTYNDQIDHLFFIYSHEILYVKLTKERKHYTYNHHSGNFSMTISVFDFINYKKIIK